MYHMTNSNSGHMGHVADGKENINMKINTIYLRKLFGKPTTWKAEKMKT